MPLSLQIDRCNRRVVTRATGAVIESDFVEVRQQIRASRAFNSCYSHLLDLREATGLELSPVAVLDMARTSVFAAGSVHAILAQTDLQADLGHMVAAICQAYERYVRVFRDPAQADKWLCDASIFAARRRGTGIQGTLSRRRISSLSSVTPVEDNDGFRTGEGSPVDECSEAGVRDAVVKIATPTRHNPLLLTIADGSTLACWVEIVEYRPYWAFITRELQRIRGPRYQKENTIAKIRRMIETWHARPSDDGDAARERKDAGTSP